MANDSTNKQKIDVRGKLRDALITGTAGATLGGMVLEGGRIRVPTLLRKLARMRRKTVGLHGGKAGFVVGAGLGLSKKRPSKESADTIAAGGDWNFSAFIEDMKVGALPKDVQADVRRFVDAKAGTPVVHYGMTVKELLGKADVENLKSARKTLGTLRASRARDEVLGKVKDGSKYILIMNDRIVDGHHFLAKAERGAVTSSLNVLDLTPARVALTEFGTEDERQPTRTQSALLGAGGTLAAGGLVLGTRGGRNALRGLLGKFDKHDPRRLRLGKLLQKRQEASRKRAADKAVAQARDAFRAEALPKPPQDPGLVDAVKKVGKRARKRVVNAVANIGANPTEVQMQRRGRLVQFAKDEPPQVDSWNPLKRRAQKQAFKQWLGQRPDSAGVRAADLEQEYEGVARKRRMVGEKVAQLLHPLAGGIGSFVAAPAATVRDVIAQHRAVKKLEPHLKGNHPQTATETPQAHTYGETAAALKKQNVGFFKRHLAAIATTPMRSGANAAFVPMGKQGVIVAAKGAHPAVMKHEDGHGKDFRHYGGERGFRDSYKHYGSGRYGKRYLPHTLLPEKRAWQQAGKLDAEGEAIRDAAMETYARNGGYVKRGGDKRTKAEKVVDAVSGPLALGGMGYAAVKTGALAKAKWQARAVAGAAAGTAQRAARQAGQTRAGRNLRAMVLKANRRKPTAKRTKVVPKGRGPLLDAATGRPIPALPEKKFARIGGRLFAFETPVERRNRVRDLRDKIGLAKDVAGLGVIGGVGYGAHKLYQEGKSAIPYVKATARSWHRTAGRTKRTMDAVHDAVAPSKKAGIGKAVGTTLRVVARKIGIMHDPRRPVQFQQPPKRDRLQQVRDVALTGAALGGLAGGGYLIHQGRKIKTSPMARQMKRTAQNVQQATSITADIGRAYNTLKEPITRPKRVIAGVRRGWRQGLKEGQTGPTKGWAKTLVRAGKALKILQARQRLTEFGATGALIGTLAGTLVGSAAGSRYKGAVQGWVRRKLAPHLSRKWMLRASKAASYAPENIGGMVGGTAGSFLTGGMRKPKEQEFGQRFARLGGRLIQFGGNDQLGDLDRGTFVRPMDILIGRKQGYARSDVKEYNDLKKYLRAVKDGVKQGHPDKVAAAKAKMEQIRANPGQLAAGQILRSAYREGEKVQRWAGRGGSLIKDARAHLRGDPRERDASGRVKKREWEKGWFDRAKGSALAGGGLLAGALVLRGHPRLRSRVDRAARQMARKVNHPVKSWGHLNIIPQIGKKWKGKDITKARTAMTKPWNSGGVTAKTAPKGAYVSPKKAQAKVAQTQQVSQQAAQNIHQQATGAPLPTKPATSATPANASNSGPPSNIVSITTGQPASKPAVAPKKTAKPAAAGLAPKKKAAAAAQPTKPAPAPVVTAPKPEAPNSTGSLWSQSKILNEPAAVKPAAVKPAAVKPAVKPVKKAKAKPKPEYDGKTGKWKMARIGGRLIEFDDPFDAGWDLRDARGRSARVFAPDAGQRDRRPKRWHEKVENERKLWAGAAATGTLGGAVAMHKLIGKSASTAVQAALKTERAKIRAALQKARALRRARANTPPPGTIPFPNARSA